jgi:hypothetical protein
MMKLGSKSRIRLPRTPCCSFARSISDVYSRKVLREELLRLAAEVAAPRSNPNNWFPPELAVTFNVTCTIELLTWWLRQKHPVSIARVAEIHERVIITPTIETDKNWTRRVKKQKKS